MADVPLERRMRRSKGRNPLLTRELRLDFAAPNILRHADPRILAGGPEWPKTAIWPALYGPGACWLASVPARFRILRPLGRAGLIPHESRGRV